MNLNIINETPKLFTRSNQAESMFTTEFYTIARIVEQRQYVNLEKTIYLSLRICT